jgi:thiol-disulfide isomerase/thioredoxin
MARPRTGAIAMALLMAPLTALGLLAGCTAKAATPGPSQTIQVFQPADRKPSPDLVGDLLDGSGTFKLADHVGEVVVINFWGSWCAPCVAEADDLEATYLATKDSKVTFIGINVRDERDPAKSFLVGRATYASLFDPSSKLALAFAVAPTTIPTTIIVDRAGRIAAIARAAVQRDELEPVVKTLAAESS